MSRRGEKTRNSEIKFTELFSTNFRHQTEEFFGNSTLHGVRYIAEPGRSFGEKFMWFCCVAIGAVAAFVIINSLWEKFQTNPTITGLDTDFHNQELEFPTVAICPVEPWDEEILNETAYQKLGGYEDNYVEYIPVLEMLTTLSYDNFNLLQSAISVAKVKLNNIENLRNMAFKVAMKCEDLLETCKFRGEEITCCEYFTTIYTERGFCFAFNARYVGISNEEIRNERINNLFETDKKWAISFVLNRPSKVYIHSVEEISGNDFRPQFSWENDFSVDLLITMKQTYTTHDSKQLTVGQRKCIFQGEVDLNYYNNDVYSLSACMKQCRMQKAFKLCKCIPPFYEPAKGSYRQCVLSDFICLSRYRGNITDIRGCLHCQLSCLNTVYESEKFTKNLMLSSNKKEDSRVNIEFLTWPIIRYKREVLFGWVDLLVSFGGIAGLFLGFSLLSGVEIVYYFTMRAGCMFVKNRALLYALQHEKKTRPPTRYDLSLTPNFKSFSRRERRRSESNIKIVKPVELDEVVKSKISLRSVTPTKNHKQQPLPQGKINISTVFGRFRKDASDKNIFLRRKNVFHRAEIAPYATQIKPLDINFKSRSRSEGPPDVIFYGYLP